MITLSTVTAFAVVFTVFIVVVAVLLVLVIRFTLQRASASRAAWAARLQDDEDEDEDEDEEEDEEEPRALTALVLAGGGSRGAIQIGMLQVLAEHGFVPDRIYGTSVGAINGVAFAGDPTRSGVERMTEVWLGLNRETVYPRVAYTVPDVLPTAGLGIRQQRTAHDHRQRCRLRAPGGFSRPGGGSGHLAR